MTVRKMSTIHDLEELNLDAGTRCAFQAAGVDVRDLIESVRRDHVWATYDPSTLKHLTVSKVESYHGICERCAHEAVAAVDQAGFILHESELSINIRRFVTKIIGVPQIYMDHYETLEDLSKEAIAAVRKTIREGGELTNLAIGILEDHFGLRGNRPLPLDEIADQTGMPLSPLKRSVGKALKCLHRDDKRSKLEVATCYSRVALKDRAAELRFTINRAQRELELLEANSPFSS